MKLYTARITDHLGTTDYLVRAYRYPSDDSIRECLRLPPTARVESVAYVGDETAPTLVTAAGPVAVTAPGRASG